MGVFLIRSIFQCFDSDSFRIWFDSNVNRFEYDLFQMLWSDSNMIRLDSNRIQGWKKEAVSSFACQKKSYTK